MTTLISELFNGLSLGSILLLAALGLSITFGLMNVINMAHGELIMIGAYTTYVMQNLFIVYLPKSFFSFYFIVAIPLSFIVAAIVGIIIERFVIQFLYSRPLDTLLATWGVSLILQQAARTIFGAPNVAVKSPAWLSGQLNIGALSLPYKRLFIIGLVILTLVLLFLYLYRTNAGRRIRAVTLNREMASCLGISTRKVDAFSFGLGSGLAGIAGCALTLLGSIGPTLGSNYLVDAFMIVILGGIGKLKGIIIGAVLVGLCSTFFEFLTNTSVSKMLVFALIIIFMQWKPSGLFSVKSRALD